MKCLPLNLWFYRCFEIVFLIQCGIVPPWWLSQRLNISEKMAHSFVKCLEWRFLQYGCIKKHVQCRKISTKRITLRPFRPNYDCLHFGTKMHFITSPIYYIYIYYICLLFYLFISLKFKRLCFTIYILYLFTLFFI
jgi:hypothetical protein